MTNAPGKSTVDRRTVLRLGAVAGAAATLGAPALARADIGPATTPTYLTGVLAPVPDETDSRELTVEGAIPPELTGRYLRNGPNPHPGTDPGNWWLGAGMVHGVRLRAGRAEWYRNRWIRTLDPPPLPDGRPDLRGGAANTSIVHHGGKILALYEVRYPYELTENLDTVGPCDFGGRLRTGMTAHPKEDPRTGELHFFGYAMSPPFLTYHRLSAAGELVRSVPVDLPEATFMHDFAITANHVVWLDLPVVWDAAGARASFPNWSDTHQPRIGVMPKDGTSADVRWFPVDPRWAFHVANAHEDRTGRIVLDLIGGTGPEWEDMRRFFAGDTGVRAMGFLRRWTIDPVSGRVREQVLCDHATEFPTINEDRVGLGHRYVYSPTTPLARTRHNRILKHDTRTGRQAAHYLGRDKVAGETLFVPAERGRAEDDGWLIALVHDLTRKASSMVILNATAPSGRPVATVHLPRHVPYGFHGCWIPDSAVTPG